ncbi:phosphate ABC transporter substrate-binding protein, PhoT family [Quadrisphaera granulorum]|uniref:Phosphate-binding protein n=1 Tax=Quadrisphaera granulorum TaxID=317664 RepID=A0A316A2I8_9ACTN|nr:phosphate ABC transporter substrate-binding protein PstS [Quadrisphaera granulorum]PWJ51789.1 phosphate ABC transporter substrate-binding protein (PhoT family) [Quadrisphaera granulorum]SZE97736.1 phosphate ABC transporter substrate-binding protein, PhoT family [Quadrisphaera granulorum]
MKRSTLGRAAIPAAIVLSLGLASCASNEQPTDSATSADPGAGSSSSAPELEGTLNGAGSSAQQAAMQSWIAGITNTSPGLTVNYDPAGSGAGRTQFLSGAVQFAGSDAYLKDEELTKAQERCNGGTAIDIPDYVSPIAIAYNLEGVKDLKLSPEVIAQIFDGKITTWNDPAIAAENAGVTLPATAINPVHRADESGTTANFTDYLSKASNGAWSYKPGQEWPAQGGEAAQGTSGVVAAIKATAGSIGYADESQAKDLGHVQVKVGSGYVGPTAEAAAKALDEATPASGRPEGDIALDINRTPTATDAYPVILVSYLIGCTSYADATEAANVKGFFTYVTSKEGQDAAAKAAGSAPISDSLREQITTSLELIK